MSNRGLLAPALAMCQRNLGRPKRDRTMTLMRWLWVGRASLVAAVASLVLALLVWTESNPLAQVLEPSPAPITVAPLLPDREWALKPKDAFKECATCPEMVVVPAGEFMMGSPANEKGHNNSEDPQHPVTI